MPEWPSAVFWPLLSDSEGTFLPFVVDSTYLPLSEELIISGRAGANLFKSGIPNTNVLALRIDFSQGAIS